MVPLIVSFRRTGTHALAKLLHQNLRTGKDSYENLHYSHSRIPATPYIHIWRPILPTMLSMWQMRERFGVRVDTPFSRFIRAPYPDLFVADACKVDLDGVERTDAHRIKGWDDEPLSIPERWLRDTNRFAANAAINVSYHAISDCPLRVISATAMVFELEPVGELKLLRERVGWVPSVETDPGVVSADLLHLQKFEQVLRGYEFAEPVVVKHR